MCLTSPLAVNYSHTNILGFEQPGLTPDERSKLKVRLRSELFARIQNGTWLVRPGVPARS